MREGCARDRLRPGSQPAETSIFLGTEIGRVPLAGMSAVARSLGASLVPSAVQTNLASSGQANPGQGPDALEASVSRLAESAAVAPRPGLGRVARLPGRAQPIVQR